MLADTTLLIDFLRGKENAVMMVEEIERSGTLFTTEINVFELMIGIYAGSENVEVHTQKMLGILSKLVVLSLDRLATIRAAKIAGDLIKTGQKIEGTDSLIAGIALSNGINEIVTRNKSHFDRISEIKVITY